MVEAVLGAIVLKQHKDPEGCGASDGRPHSGWLEDNFPRQRGSRGDTTSRQSGRALPGSEPCPASVFGMGGFAQLTVVFSHVLLRSTDPGCR